MRKILAIVLAVAMVMSMASVAFAAESFAADSRGIAQATKDNASTVYKYSADNDRMRPVGTTNPAEYNGAVYIPLFSDVSTATAGDWNHSDATGKQLINLIDTFDYVEGLKIKGKWEMNGDMVAGVSLVRKYVDFQKVDGNGFGPDVNGGLPVEHIASGVLFGAATNDPAGTGSNWATAWAAGDMPAGYYYFIEIKIKDSSATKDIDVIGTLTLNKTKEADAASGGSSFKIKDVELDIAFNVSYEKNYIEDANYVVTTNFGDELAPDTYYLLKFDDDDEVDLLFGNADSAQNEGTFTVDVSGQGKVLLYFTTTADDNIVAANPDAALRFVNFNNVKFNRTGEYVYEWEDVKYVYEIVDGMLVTPKNWWYDAADEAVYFITRELGSYVFSDTELVNAVADEPVVEAPVDEVISNPATGGY